MRQRHVGAVPEHSVERSFALCSGWPVAPRRQSFVCHTDLMSQMKLHLFLRHLNHPLFPQLSLVPALPFSPCLPLKILTIHSHPSASSSHWFLQYCPFMHYLSPSSSLRPVLPCLLLFPSQFLVLLRKIRTSVLLHFPVPSLHPSFTVYSHIFPSGKQ